MTNTPLSNALNILTLVAPEPGILTDQVITEIQQVLNAKGANPSPYQWLSENIAVDIVFQQISPHQAARLAQEIIGELKIDIIAQHTATRRKKLLLADMDSTIVCEETLDEIAEQAGIGTQVAEITTRAMRGELDFKQALRERVRMLAGKPANLLDDVLNRMRLTPGAIALVQTMRRHGAHCVLVTGGFDYFAERVCKQTGFHEFVANSLIVDDNQITGQVREPINDGTAKLNTLNDRQQTLGLGADDILAVGDGANDLQMIRAAGLGVSYYGKPKLEEAVYNRIRHCDLTALLYAQGYKNEEIIKVE